MKRRLKINIKETDIIIIDSGATFEGTLEQFEDCFFSNAKYESIKEWCDKNKSILEIKEKEIEIENSN